MYEKNHHVQILKLLSGIKLQKKGVKLVYKLEKPVLTVPGSNSKENIDIKLCVLS